MFRNTAVLASAKHYPAQIEVQVVVERHADSSVDLHAVLRELHTIMPDIGLPRREEVPSILRVCCMARTEFLPHYYAWQPRPLSYYSVDCLAT